MNEELFFPAHREAFREAIEGLHGKRVAVLGHLRPDGDCIGCQVGMARFLRAQGIEAIAVNKDEVPPALEFLTSETSVLLPEAVDVGDWVAVTVDCADFKRIGSALQERFPQVWLNVDHHISNQAYARHNIVMPDRSATGEVLAGLFLDAGHPMDPATAQALYVGIATDTGQFRYRSTTPLTFEMARRLQECGADPAAAAIELYEREPWRKIRLTERFLASLKLYAGGRLCVGVLSPEDFAETGAGKADSEGLVEWARTIDGVEVAVYLESRPEGIKGSFRGKSDRYRLDQLAAQFNGGGHASAAGFNMPAETAETFLPRLIEAVERQIATAPTT